MEFLDCIAEIYVGVAGAGAAIWVLCEKYAPKLKMKFTGIGIWFLLRFVLLYCTDSTDDADEHCRFPFCVEFITGRISAEGTDFVTDKCNLVSG